MSYRIREEHGKFMAEVIQYQIPDLEPLFQPCFPLGDWVDTLAEARSNLDTFVNYVPPPPPPPPKFHPYP